MTEENVIIKLFDTLRDAIKDMHFTLKEMLSNQKTIATYMETLPIDDLRTSLKDHNKESTDNIDECTEVINNQSHDIMKKLDKIHTIIYKTTVVVWVFIGVVSLLFTYNKFIKPNPEDLKLQKTVVELKQVIQKQTEESDNKIEKQLELIEKLREEVRELNKE